MKKELRVGNHERGKGEALAKAIARKVVNVDLNYMICFWCICSGIIASVLIFSWVGLLFWLGIVLGFWGGVRTALRHLQWIKVKQIGEWVYYAKPLDQVNRKVRTDDRN